MSRISVIVMCISANLLSLTTQAMEHSLQCSLSARAEHVDNVFLSRYQEDYLASSILTPGISYSISEPTWQGQIKTSENLRHTSDPSFDANDYSYSANFNRQGEYSSVSAEVSRLDTTVRQVNLAESGRATNDPLISDTASAKWQHQLTTYDSLSINGQYARRNYTSPNYSDFDDWNLSSLWQHSFSSIFAAQIEAYFGEYRSERFDLSIANIPPTIAASENTSNNTGVQIGFFGQINPSLHYNFLTGAAQVDTDQSVTFYLDDGDRIPYFERRTSAQSDTNQFAATIGYKGEHSQLNLTANKQLQGSGDGLQYDTRILQLNGHKRLTEFYTLTTSVTYGEQKALTGSEIQSRRFDRQFGYVSSGLSHQISQHFSGSVSLIYNTQKYEASPDRAESFTGIIQLRYAPPALRW